MNAIANLHLTRSKRIGIRVLSLLVGCAIVGVAQTAMAQALLRRGSSGQAVTDLQNRLQELGCYDGGITGFFGEQTEAGVIRCQQRFRLQPDGIAGTATLNALGLVSTGNSGADQYGNPLQLGDRGEAVRQLQAQLRSSGYYYGQIDGVFGSETQTAVLQLQRQFGLAQTGRADEQVYAVLRGNATPPTARVDLRKGDQNDRVTELQRRLASLGYSVGITGYFGDQTENAIFQFQQSYGLRPTGVADAQTLRLLQVPSTSAGSSAPLNPRRYSVIIPVPTEASLRRVREVLPNVNLVEDRRGFYVRVAVYNTPEEADRRVGILRSQGFSDARVIFQ